MVKTKIFDNLAKIQKGEDIPRGEYPAKKEDITLEHPIEKIAKLNISDREIEYKIVHKETCIPLGILRKEVEKIDREKEKQRKAEERKCQEKDKFNAYDIALKCIVKKKVITSEEIDRIYCYDDGIYTFGEKTLLKDLQKLLKKECSEARVKEIFGHIKRTTYKTEKEISGTNGNHICLKNGLFNLNDNTLSEFDTNKIFFNKIPVDFVKGAECPKFKIFLKRACSMNGKFDAEKYNTIQEYMGYCLEKGYKIHKFLIVYGDSDTSKTQFMIILQNMLGKDNFESIYPQQFFKDNYSIMLYKKMANIADEIPSGVISTTKIKGLSGESEITGRELYSKPFKFINEAKLVFAGNKLPKLGEDDVDDDAVFNRPMLIKFNNKIKDADKIEKFGERLFSEEGSGILNFMIAGLNRLNEQKKFSYSNTIEENKEIWFSETEPIYRFFINCEEVGFEKGAKCSKCELYVVYCEWCDNNGIQWLENNAFARKVCTLFKNKVISSQILNRTLGKQEHCWVGINISSGVTRIE